jgi:beta-ureidopropionase / N-carbamoyl-L-amino-acid hydrolase
VDAPELFSGAGHDAENAQLAGVPTGMLFVRSTGGSHNPNELATLDDAVLGARALALALRELAG